MLLIGDETHDHGRIPWVTCSLLTINIVAFCMQSFLGDRFTAGFSLVPYEITHLKDLTKPERVKVKQPVRVHYVHGKKHTERQYEYRETWVEIPHAPGPFPIFLTLFTSMFLHGNWVHLIGNMWFLVLFGRNVECALDHGRFLLFYVSCGLAGGLVYTFTDPNSVLPCLGASGAISGILGAYIAIYPFNPIKVWLGWYLGVIQVPAFVVVGIWFIFQYLAAFAALDHVGHNVGGIAYWDHLGGFAAGVAIVKITIWHLRRKARQLEEELAEEEASDVVARELQDQPPPQDPPEDPFAHCLPQERVEDSLPMRLPVQSTKS